MASTAGERRHVTVLFSDLVDSTALASSMDPEDWQALARRYHELATAVVTRFAGHVAKLLGDGVLTTFGYPEAHEDDAERAVRAGLALVEGMTSVVGPGGTAIGVRVALHTGEIVVGGDGELFGDVVHVAARLQALAPTGALVASGATLRLVRGIFLVDDLGPQTLKGIPNPVATFRVRRPTGVRSRLDVAAGRLTPFVGRGPEIALIADRWARVRDGDGQAVWIAGEPGVGKSRLVYEFRERVADMPHTWLECRCTPFSQDTPFQPVRELVERGLGFRPEDTPDEKRGKLVQGLSSTAKTEGRRALAELLGLEPPGATRSADMQRSRMLDVLTTWVCALGRLQPLVVLFEDLHWMDASSLEVLGRLLTQAPTAPFLLLGTARPEFEPPWHAPAYLTPVKLARLTKRHGREMVAALTAGARIVPAEVLDALTARADGVPLFIEELSRAVMESTRPGDVAAIPETLQDSLMARLDALGAAKEVAQRAAVLGRDVAYPLLHAMAGLDETTLQSGLAALVDAEIVYPRGLPPTSTYIFKHALVQEAAYGSLLKRVRQELHARVARMLVERFPERCEEEPQLVARHAEAAGDVETAVRYYQRAAQQAQRRWAHEEAIRLSRHAIALLPTTPASRERDVREVELQLLLGGSLAAMRGYAHDEAGVACERAVLLAERIPDCALLAEALGAFASFVNNRGDVIRAEALGTRVLALAERADDESQLLVAHVLIGHPQHYQGRFASSLVHGEEAVRMYERGRREGQRVLYGTDLGVAARGHVAWNLWHLGYPDGALARAREAVVLADQLEDPFSLAFALLFEVVTHWLRRDVPRVRAGATDVIALSERHGFPLWLGIGKMLRGAFAPDPTSGLTEIMEGLTVAGGTGSQAGAPALLVALVECQHAAGDSHAALASIDAGLAMAAQTGQHFWDAELHRLRAEILLTSYAPGVAEAAELLRRAMGIARGQGARGLELRAAISLARLHGRASRYDEARKVLTPVYETYTEGLDTADLIAAAAVLHEVSP